MPKEHGKEKRAAISSILREMGLLLELKGENPFKSRAYYNAARTVELLGEEELLKLVRDDRLKDVKGIGVALNEKIKEIIVSGSLKYYEELKASVPEGLLEMLSVPGLGPRKVKALHDLLGIATLGELEYACRENRLVNLKGFGAKTQDNIIRGIELVRRSQGRYFYSEAREIADSLLEKIYSFSALQEASLAGSLRRCMEIVRDIDMVACSGDTAALTRFFAQLPQVSEIIAEGETKASVRLQEGINADLRVVQAAEFPYALHHFTGSKEHNTAMRHRARTMGIKMNEYGLFREGKRVACSSEEDIFKALQLTYIPPELRENHGEIEAAEKGELPTLVEEEDIRGVFHVHTAYSDGANSLEETVRFCLQLGYQYVGISDHSRSAFYAGGLKEEDLKRQLEEIEMLRGKYPDISILKGVESDIRADGSLDYPEGLLKQLDFVIASVHSGLGMAREKMTDRLLRALSHPLVTMLGHPTGRLLLGREGYSIDLEEILQKALAGNVIIEFNASPARLDLDWRQLRRVKEMGLLVSINPDSHRNEEINDTSFGVAIARKGWLQKADVFNTRSRREVEEFLSARRQQGSALL